MILKEDRDRYNEELVIDAKLTPYEANRFVSEMEKDSDLFNAYRHWRTCFEEAGETLHAMFAHLEEKGVRL